MLTKPEELVGMLSKPGEFVASAYDFAEQLLTSQRKFAEGMVEATKPLVGDTEGVPLEKWDPPGGLRSLRGVRRRVSIR